MAEPLDDGAAVGAAVVESANGLAGAALALEDAVGELVAAGLVLVVSLQDTQTSNALAIAKLEVIALRLPDGFTRSASARIRQNWIMEISRVFSVYLRTSLKDRPYRQLL